ncbi:hypothetical protein [Cellulosimicrobium sp. CUA-896]|uniref:hypothetical protein n=1 Tax=Cellulosimicrobium sp. CUA-896 TaxID=1517881 RepID=UPI00095D782D|nr:hypothetical protein [Cellulosimicrobium sp. CUA-896]OLT53979.1 hypothetical protein BJF88_00290 [Cellulosimicrobium sp. CUA-896]
MPTVKPRHAITETESVARALAVARRRWPGEPATKLLTHLIEEGASAVEREEADDRADHRRAVAALTTLGDYYPDGYLDDVRAGWDE